jgi:CHAD domain-containing protein
VSKAVEIAGLECSSDALVWAAEVLRTRFDEIVERRGAVLDSDDIEAVHDMRVATRRLRSALRDFAPILRTGPLKPVTRELKKLADLLGAARDQDVAIIALKKLKKKAPDQAVETGIGRLINECRTKRKSAQIDLVKALAARAIDDLRRRFYAAIDAAAQKKPKSKAVSFTDAGRQAILKSLDEFGDLSASLYAPFKIKKLHRLRISAKRLRYAVELFTACWGARIAPFAEEISELQSFLGEVHDADGRIENFSRRLLENDPELFPANLWLLSRFVKIRDKNYRRTLELWSRWQTERLLERLRELVSEQ